MGSQARAPGGGACAAEHGACGIGGADCGAAEPVACEVRDAVGCCAEALTLLVNARMNACMSDGEGGWSGMRLEGPGRGFLRGRPRGLLTGCCCCCCCAW
eukprot:scaffold75267_cov17-Tisochrysis_lutea.AAC.1